MRAIVAGAAFLGMLALVQSAELIPGPINARVVNVYDGDTFTADAMSWPGVTIRTAVRVDGVDTPEIRGECQGMASRVDVPEGPVCDPNDRSRVVLAPSLTREPRHNRLRRAI
jgi:endonuclease YncB( thermonuclease family)